jgi:CheY-like chemotaxis protein
LKKNVDNPDSEVQIMSQLFAGSLSGIRVLIVDDAPDNRLLISRFLALAGALVTTASNASEGISIALAGDFDVILMDIQMPGMDGYEAVKRLRSLHYSRPIIALTAHAMQSDKDQCLRSGFDQYLTKPVSRPELIASIAGLGRAAGPTG